MALFVGAVFVVRRKRAIDTSAERSTNMEEDIE